MLPLYPRIPTLPAISPSPSQERMLELEESMRKKSEKNNIAFRFHLLPVYLRLWKRKITGQISMSLSNPHNARRWNAST